MVIFWDRVHSIYPVVHRTSFERGIKSGRHLTDKLFGMTVLGACAVASRYSDDPRVFTRFPLDPDEFEGSTAGWKWITQVPIWRNTLCDRTTMYDIQFFAVSFFHCSSNLRFKIRSVLITFAACRHVFPWIVDASGCLACHWSGAQTVPGEGHPQTQGPRLQAHCRIRGGKARILVSPLPFMTSKHIEELIAIVLSRCLISSDRVQSSFLGRSPAIHDEE
jgi:hypothetical protein